MNNLREMLGAKHLDALEAVRGRAATPAHMDRLGREFGVTAARWAFDQWDLRHRARAKFERAEEMLFDREALEMATHEKVARMHAASFPSGARVADLTVGIGADLIALSREHDAVGFEIDPIRAALARHNLHVHGLTAEIRVADAMAADWDFDYAFADPARRSGGKRTVRPEDSLPPLPELAARMNRLAMGLIKTSPMLRDEDLRAFGGRVDFWSFGGECREAILRVGREPAREDGSADASASAFHVESGRWLSSLDFDHAGVDPEPLTEPLALVYEADPAAIRAHALADLCSHLNARLLGDSNGYLTGSEPPQDLEGQAFSRLFHCVAFGRADIKRIREELRRLDAKVTAVKTRAVKEDPQIWLTRLKCKGASDLVLMIYPVGKSIRYLLAEPKSA